MRIDFDEHRAMTATLTAPVAAPTMRARRSPRRQPWMPLLNAVLALAGERAELVRHGETPWVSITFAGSRHRIALAFRGTDAVAAGEAFIAALPEHEFAISRQLVADATVVSAEHALLPEPVLTVEAELLLLEEV